MTQSACVVQVLFFLVELIQRGAEGAARTGDDSLTVFGLHLVHRAVAAAGGALAAHPALVELIQQRLFPALAAAMQYPGLGSINGLCQVCVWTGTFFVFF